LQGRYGAPFYCEKLPLFLILSEAALDLRDCFVEKPLETRKASEKSLRDTA
jgi:hypothetical protein